MELIDHGNERNQNHFGLSKGEANGHGFGPKTSKRIVNKLKRKSCSINDFADIFFTKNIGPDTFSDLITSVCYSELVKYTLVKNDVLDFRKKESRLKLVWDLQTSSWVKKDIIVFVKEVYKKIV